MRKALGSLEKNPRHLGLHTHKYSDCKGPNGEDVFAAYAGNRTPAADRILVLPAWSERDRSTGDYAALLSAFDNAGANLIAIPRKH